MHFQFRDRIFAAHALSNILKNSLSIRERENCLILGIPRAGVLTADIIARKLQISNFDIIIPRKLTDPDNKEQSIGAIMEDGYKLLNEKLINELFISKDYLEKEILLQINEIKRRKNLYRTALEQDTIQEKISRYNPIILVDDGAATGFTSIIAAQWIQKSEQLRTGKMKQLVIALPIAPKPLIIRLQKDCNAKVKVVFQPSLSNFRSVEQYHRNFSIVTDQHVIEILKQRKSC